MQNLSLNDGLATPVARTFVPVQPYMGPKAPARWSYRPADAVDRTSNVLIELGYRRNGVTSMAPLKVQVPYTVTVNGVIERGLALFDSSSGGFRIPDNAPVVVVNNLYAFVGNFLAHADIMTAVKSGRPVI